MSVYYFDSAQQGAPTLNGTLGSLISVLDACLVDGFPTVDVVSIDVDLHTATVVTDGPHGFSNDDFAAITGAVEPEFNGTFQVRRVSATSFTYSLYAAPTSSATGALRVRRPSLGWSKVFADANKGAYRAPEGIRPYLQVIDAAATPGGTREAQWRGFRVMSDIDTGEEPYPDMVQRPSGLMVHKTGTANALPQPWVLVGDSRAFYIMCQLDNNNTVIPTGGLWPMWHGFGELAFPFIADDPYCCFIAANANPNAVGTNQDNGMFYPSGRSSAGASGSSAWLLRGISGISDLPTSYSNMGHCWDEAAIGEAVCLTYPHKPDNGLFITPIRAASENALRGYLPGFYECLHGNISTSILFGNVIDGSFTGLEGRKLKLITGRRWGSIGAALFDITGPWR